MSAGRCYSGNFGGHRPPLQFGIPTTIVGQRLPLPPFPYPAAPSNHAYAVVILTELQDLLPCLASMRRDVGFVGIGNAAVEYDRSD